MSLLFVYVIHSSLCLLTHIPTLPLLPSQAHLDHKILGKVCLWKPDYQKKNYRFYYIAIIIAAAAAAAKSLQLCPTLCDAIDGSPPGSPIPGILQARTLEWVAISFSNAWKWKVKVKSLSHVRPSATPWTAAHQAPLSMGFSRQEHQSGVPLPSPVIYHTDILRERPAL